jgi:hypothetical protein
MIENEMQMIGRWGEVDPLSAEVLERAEVVLRAAIVTTQEPLVARIEGRHRQRRPARRTLVGVAAAALALAGAAGGFIAAGSSPGGPPTPLQASRPVTPGHAVSVVLAASRVRLIALTSTAVADSGTVVETETDTINGVVPAPERNGIAPTTTDVTFSGQNVNYGLVIPGSSAPGVQDRVVDGQLYIYTKDSGTQMHWYHDTAPGAAADVAIPNPLTLL